MGFIPRPLCRFDYSSPFGYRVACGGVVHFLYDKFYGFPGSLFINKKEIVNMQNVALYNKYKAPY